MELYFRPCYQARRMMFETCNTPSCNSIRCCAHSRARSGQRSGGAARCIASLALLAAAACANGPDESFEAPENVPGPAPEMPSGVPFSADGEGATPLSAPGESEGQEPEPNATETNFIVFVCWDDSDCPGSVCQLYAPDAGVQAPAPAEDAGTAREESAVDRSGPPRGRCRVP